MLNFKLKIQEDLLSKKKLTNNSFNKIKDKFRILIKK